MKPLTQDIQNLVSDLMSSEGEELNKPELIESPVWVYAKLKGGFEGLSMIDLVEAETNA